MGDTCHAFRGNLHLTHERDGMWFEFVLDTTKFINMVDDNPQEVIRKLMDGLNDFRPAR